MARLYKDTILITFGVSYLIHLIVSIYIFQVNSVGVDAELLKVNFLYKTVGFFARLLIFYVLISLVFRQVVSWLGWKKKWLASISFLLICHIKSWISYPQLYDDLPSLPDLPGLVPVWFDPYYINLALMLFLLAAAGRLILIHGLKSRNIFAAIILVFFALGLGLEGLSLPGKSFSPAEKLTNVGKPKPIIILSVDSLPADYDFNANIKNLEELPALGKFLSLAKHFPKVLTPQVQTHISLASFLSEKRVQDIGPRSFLDANFFDDKNFYVGESLKKLKQNGYELNLLMDGQEFVHYKKNEIFTHWWTPEQGLGTFIFPLINRSGLFYSFFRNFPGKFFFPEMTANSAFSAGYELDAFREMVQKRIVAGLTSTNPLFLFSHACGLHWPTSSPWPYYKQILNGDVDAPENVIYATGSRYYLRSYVRNLTAEEWVNQVRYDLRVFNATVNWLAREYLNPVLQTIEDTIGLENAIVVLTSDHGEDHWLSGRYPSVKLATHTSGPLFSARAENIMFRAIIPNSGELVNLQPHKNIASYKVLNSLVSVAQQTREDEQVELEDQYVYSEAGLTMFANFPGRFVAYDTDFIRSMFVVRDDGSMVSRIDPKVATVEKVRAVRFQNYRFTIYPTEFGYQSFLCDVEKDKSCETNLEQAEPKIANQMLAALNEYSEKDIAAGRLVELIPDPLRPGFYKFPYSNLQNNPWLSYLAANQALNSFNNINLGRQLMLSILANKNADEYLLRRVNADFLKRCSIFKPEDIFLSKINKLEEIYSYIKADYRLIPQKRFTLFWGRVFACLGFVKRADLFDKLKLEVQPNMDPRLWDVYVEYYNQKNEADIFATLSTFQSPKRRLGLYQVSKLIQSSLMNSTILKSFFDITRHELIPYTIKEKLSIRNGQITIQNLDNLKIAYRADLEYNLPQPLSLYNSIGLHSIVENPKKLFSFVAEAVSEPVVSNNSLLMFSKRLKSYNRSFKKINEVISLFENYKTPEGEYADAGLFKISFIRFLVKEEGCKRGFLEVVQCHQWKRDRMLPINRLFTEWIRGKSVNRAELERLFSKYRNQLLDYLIKYHE